MASLEARVRAQEAQCVVPEATSTIGRCVFENRSALARLADAVEAKADSASTKRLFDESAAATKAAVQGLRDETASLEYARSLEAVSEGLSERLTSAERSLATKLEKGEAAKIQACCDRLKSADKKLEFCLDELNVHKLNIESAREDRESIKKELRERDFSLTQKTNALETTTTHISSSLSSVTTKADDLDVQLKRTNREVGRLATDVHERFDRAASRDSDIETLTQRLALTNRADTAKLQKVVSAESTKVDTKLLELQKTMSAATSLDIDRAIARLHDHALKQLKDRTAVLETQGKTTQQQLGLALRFVDWFAKRGQAYEHNMGALDRRLDSMVLCDDRGSRPIKDAFSANVRITP